MEFLPLYIIESALWIVCLSLTLYRLRFFWIGKKHSALPAIADKPTATIVITAHNQAYCLRQSLPAFLEQNYSSPFQVVVVDIHSDDETADLLEHLEEGYPHLSHTVVPDSARDISLQRLALTLGARSTSTEWIIFTTACCCPQSQDWLERFMLHCTPARNAVLGFTRYEDVKGWKALRWQFFHLWQQMLWMPYAQTVRPYRADEQFWAYRRSHFLEHKGFAQHINLAGGAATLLINGHVRHHQCGICLDQMSSLLQELPAPHLWTQDRVFFMETRRHIRHGFLYRLWYFMHAVCPTLFTLCTAAIAVLAYPDYTLMGILAALWLFVHILTQVAFRLAARQMETQSFHLLLPLFQALVPWWDATAWLRWRFTKKRTFRKKFV